MHTFSESKKNRGSKASAALLPLIVLTFNINLCCFRIFLTDKEKGL